MRLWIIALTILILPAVIGPIDTSASARPLPTIQQLRAYSIRQLQDCALLNSLRAAYSASDIRLEHWPKAKAIIPWYSANCMNQQAAR
jgi:hypothetical protein